MEVFRSPLHQAANCSARRRPSGSEWRLPRPCWAPCGKQGTWTGYLLAWSGSICASQHFRGDSDSRHSRYFRGACIFTGYGSSYSPSPLGSASGEGAPIAHVCLQAPGRQARAAGSSGAGGDLDILPGGGVCPPKESCHPPYTSPLSLRRTPQMRRRSKTGSWSILSYCSTCLMYSLGIL